MNKNVQGQEIKTGQSSVKKIQLKKQVKKKKIRAKHSSAYNIQIKEITYQLKREKQWNSRFTLSSIPQLITQTKKKDEKTKSKLKKKLPQPNLSKSYKTLNIFGKKRGGSREFNIKNVSKHENPRQSANQFHIDKKEKLQQTKKREEISEVFYFQKQKLIKSIGELRIKDPSLDSHYNLLIGIIENSQHLSCKANIELQIKNLTEGKSSAQGIMKQIKRRQKMLAQFKQQGKKTLTEDEIMDYREITSIVFQQILAWKVKWQEYFFDLTRKSASLEFGYEGRNYFLAMGKDTLFLTKNQPDPFLLSQIPYEKFEEEAKIKIRACQLLLLEQELDSLKG